MLQTWFLVCLPSNPSSDNTFLTYGAAPLDNAVRYTKGLLNDQLKSLPNGTVLPDPDNQGFGSPSPEVEDAWARLLQCKYRRSFCIVKCDAEPVTGK